MSFFEFPHTRTYDSDLGWLIKECKDIDAAIRNLEEWKAATDPKLEDMYALYNQMINGDLPAGVQEGIRQWLSINAIDIIGEMVKMVFFGITQDGYFVAYIPESWDDVIFGTSGLDDFPTGVEYGHLTLSLLIGGY